MGNKRDSKTAMFLMEMIAVVCFFILCAGVCILVFVRANYLSRLSQDTNRAALAAESVAEVWKTEEADGLAARFGMTGAGTEPANSPATILWDADWKPAFEEGKAEFCGYVEITAEGRVETASVRIVRMDDDTELFALTVKRLAGH